MKVQDLENYFAKKIAKPIAYDLPVLNEFGLVHHYYYAVEPTGVSDEAVSAMVTLKYTSRSGRRSGNASFLGDITVPFKDGDLVESILLLAIAAATSSRDLPKVERNEDLMERAREEWEAREAERTTGPSL
jgi:hypothetical protein